MKWIKQEFRWCDVMSEAAFIAWGYLYIGDDARNNNHFDGIVGFYSEFGHVPSVQQMSAYVKAKRRPAAQTQAEPVSTTSVVSGADSMDFYKFDDPFTSEKARNSLTTTHVSTQTDAEEVPTQHQPEASDLQQINNSATLPASGSEDGFEEDELVIDEKDIPELNNLIRKRSQSPGTESNPSEKTLANSRQ